MKKALLACLVSALPLAPIAAQPAEQPDLSDLSAQIREGKTTSEAVTAAYVNRIAQIDDAGPEIHAVIAISPDAMEQARALDAELKAGHYRGPMHGIPILLKDNIEAAGSLPTTAGSLALKDNVTGRDAPLVARLRAAGAVILGKTNLSEWANIRSNKSTSGWSAAGGQTKNPYALDHNPCGSSSGSGAAVAAGMAAGAIGTETDGSIVCPSSINGIVGFKPTLGLVSRRFIVPISHSQDTAGPMAHSVRDAAMILTAIAGTDPQDPATADADKWRGDYTADLSPDALKGLRIGVIREKSTNASLFDTALAVLKQGGAELVDVDTDYIDGKTLGEAEFKVLLTELKADLAAYLQGLPQGAVSHKTLADIIAFNKAHPGDELAYFGQETFELADKEKGLDDPDYRKALATSKQLAGASGIDWILSTRNLDLIVAQTNGPAWLTTLGEGDKFNPPSASTLPAVAGYPHLTVPMGLDNGLPVGLSFIGSRWNDHLLLKAGYAYEQLAKIDIAPTYMTEKASR